MTMFLGDGFLTVKSKLEGLIVDNLDEADVSKE